MVIYFQLSSRITRLCMSKWKWNPIMPLCICLVCISLPRFFPVSVGRTVFTHSFADFAMYLRMPTLMVRPASLRIYRNSTVRYATQWVFSPHLACSAYCLYFGCIRYSKYKSFYVPGLTMMWLARWTFESIHTILKRAKWNMKAVSFWKYRVTPQFWADTKWKER